MKAAEYARFSTDNQQENSIIYQLSAVRKYCAENGIDIVATYIDEGFSGTNTNRPGFQRMLSDAKNKLFDAVVIYDISRGSRDVGDWFSFRKQMMMLGVQVISATGRELGNMLSGDDFFFELMTVGMGQAEVLRTRQKSIAGSAVKAREGAFLGGTAPLGYDIVDGKYVINPQEAAVVQKIFSLYADGRSYDYIIERLLGACGKRGKPLGRNSLYSILNNERYIGTYSWNKRKVKLMRKWAGGAPNPDAVIIEGIIPPIIEESVWDAVQERMRDNKRNAKNTAKREYLLSGLIECECCGSTYTGRTSRNQRGVETSYYCCGEKYRTHKCDARNINASKLESFVIQAVRLYLMNINYEDTAKRIAQMVNGATPDLAKEKAELAQIDTKIQNGVKAILSGMKIPELEQEIDRLRVRKLELEDIIRRRESERPKVSEKRIAEVLREDAENIGNGNNLREIVKTHVAKVIAHADGSYTVNMGVTIAGCGSAHQVVVTTVSSA